eukprot:6998479-Ditylum_brightwellii.AAC.1
MGMFRDAACWLSQMGGIPHTTSIAPASDAAINDLDVGILILGSLKLRPDLCLFWTATFNLSTETKKVITTTM